MSEIDVNKSSRNSGITLLPDGLSNLKGWYVIISIKGWHPIIETISFKRKDAIKKFIANGSLSWSKCQKYGWRCIKVNIVFQPCR
jgi:hypothetical protein